jgi:hypothetical protein
MQQATTEMQADKGSRMKIRLNHRKDTQLEGAVNTATYTAWRIETVTHAQASGHHFGRCRCQV